MSRVCVIGLGYIGLPTASMLASRGHEVIGCDVNAVAVEKINSGHAHFHEPDLDMLLSAAVSTGRLRAQIHPTEAEYFIIAVPTPFLDSYKPDLSYVETATQSIAPFLKAGDVVILESTSPVGTTERMAQQIINARQELIVPAYKQHEPRENQIYLAHCPERILPGQMVRELVTNDRIIGGMSEICAAKAQELYETFVIGTCYLTDCRTAEFVKLVENSYRDVNIAFANEVSMICDRIGVDAWAAIELANKHPRVAILQPGPGVGGHCIAVDPWFIVDSAPEESRIIKLAREVNHKKTDYVVGRIMQQAERFRDPVIGIYGLTYKPDVDDLRESPAVEIVERLIDETDFRILVCEPMVAELPASLGMAGGRVRLTTEEEARRESDVIAFLVGHRVFRRLKPQMFLNKVVVDTVGVVSAVR